MQYVPPLLSKVAYINDDEGRGIAMVAFAYSHPETPKLLKMLKDMIEGATEKEEQK
jgi:hypothetical protein